MKKKEQDKGNNDKNNNNNNKAKGEMATKEKTGTITRERTVI